MFNVLLTGCSPALEGNDGLPQQSSNGSTKINWILTEEERAQIDLTDEVEQLRNVLSAVRLAGKEVQTENEELREELKAVTAERDALKAALANVLEGHSTGEGSDGSPALQTRDKEQETDEQQGGPPLTGRARPRYGQGGSSIRRATPSESSLPTSNASSRIPSPAPSVAEEDQAEPSTQLSLRNAGSDKGIVAVTLHSVSGLLGSNLLGVFVVFKLNGERRMSSSRTPSPTPASKGSSASWDQTFRLPLLGPVRSASLRVRVYSNKAMGRKSLLGETHIHLSNLCEQEEQRMRQSWPLSGVVGQIDMCLQYVGIGAPVAEGRR